MPVTCKAGSGLNVKQICRSWRAEGRGCAEEAQSITQMERGICAVSAEARLNIVVT